MEEQKNKQINLPVMAILAAAFVLPWRNKLRFLQALFVTFTILVISEYFAEKYAEVLGYKTLLLYVFNSVVYVGFAVTCHRLVLLGNAAVPKIGILRWSAREVRFFVWGVKVGILFLMSIIIIATVTAFISSATKIMFQPILIALMLPVIYYTSRIIPLFPATAVDKNYDLKWAYNLTENNGFSMVKITASIPLLVLGLSYIFDYLFGDNDVIRILILSFGYVTTVFEIAAVSLSYDFLSRHVEPKVGVENLPG